VIVRIFSDGQYRLPEDVHERLHELDNRTVAAVDSDDEAAFTTTYAELIELIHSSGERLADDDLTPSDLMLPPADITLEEARSEFTGDGLLPD
jgi:hypothetical protein